MRIVAVALVMVFAAACGDDAPPSMDDGGVDVADAQRPDPTHMRCAASCTVENRVGGPCLNRTPDSTATLPECVGCAPSCGYPVGGGAMVIEALAECDASGCSCPDSIPTFPVCATPLQ